MRTCGSWRERGLRPEGGWVRARVRVRVRVRVSVSEP